jgi:hypothetical protein
MMLLRWMGMTTSKQSATNLVAPVKVVRLAQQAFGQAYIQVLGLPPWRTPNSCLACMSGFVKCGHEEIGSPCFSFDFSFGTRPDDFFWGGDQQSVTASRQARDPTASGTRAATAKNDIGNPPRKGPEG